MNKGGLQSKRRWLVLILLLIGIIITVILLESRGDAFISSRTLNPVPTWPGLQWLPGQVSTRLIVNHSEFQTPNRSFLYLLQTESCLPQDLRHLDALGNPRWAAPVLTKNERTGVKPNPGFVLAPEKRRHQSDCSIQAAPTSLTLVQRSLIRLVSDFSFKRLLMMFLVSVNSYSSIRQLLF